MKRAPTRGFTLIEVLVALAIVAVTLGAGIKAAGSLTNNTARLAEVGQALGVPSFHIERTEDIQDEWLVDADIVGVTAGASTPDDVIEAVVAELAQRGYAPPENGIRPIDAEYVPSY